MASVQEGSSPPASPGPTAEPSAAAVKQAKRTNRPIRRVVTPKLWLSNIGGVILLGHLAGGLYGLGDFGLLDGSASSAVSQYITSTLIAGFILDVLFCIFILPFRGCITRLKKYNSPHPLSNLLTTTHNYYIFATLLILWRLMRGIVDNHDERKKEEQTEYFMYFIQVMPLAQVIHICSFTSLLYSPDIIAEFFTNYSDTFELLETIFTASVVVHNESLFTASMVFICSALFVHTFFATLSLTEHVDESKKEFYEFVWTIAGITFQDLPFLILRIIMWAKYDQVTVYYVIKNAIFIALNVWRLSKVYVKVRAKSFRGKKKQQLKSQEKVPLIAK